MLKFACDHLPLLHKAYNIVKVIFTPQPLRAVGVLFSPIVSGWAGGCPVGGAGGRAAGKSLSGLYLRNCKV